MRNRNDVIRSVKKYVAEAMPPWEVRIDNIVATEPLCIVRITTPMFHRHSSRTYSQGRWTFANSCGMQLVFYPGYVGDEEDAVLRSGEIEEEVFDMFKEGVGLGHPSRIPLYDFDGVGKDEAVPADARTIHDFIEVSNLSVEPLVEPEDRRLVSTLVSFTATWTRTGATPEIDTGLVATSVTVHPANP